jgi:uncharacterized protein (DUF1778 family)
VGVQCLLCSIVVVAPAHWGVDICSTYIQCVDMERKAKVLNLRVTDRQRTLYERAATLEGVSVSALVTSAADARAAELLHGHASMTVPSDVFDELLAALDQPAPLTPALEKALTEPRFVNR